MAFTEIDNGDSGLSARTTLNEIITYLNRLGFDLEFSDDNSIWHYGWASGDLYMRFSADFGSTWSDGIYLAYSASGASGWDSVEFDIATGNLDFYKGVDLDFTVNLDDRYALINAALTTSFKITLGAGGTVQDRIDAAISVPSGWVLTASGLDLIITHDLGRFIGEITVWAKTPALTFQKLLNTAAYSGLNASNDAVLVQSLATISADINIHVIFGE
jgi:hypothetical protein